MHHRLASMMARSRLGVALLVPPPLDREIDGLRRALGDTSLGRIPAHLTLVPPVNVRAEDRPGALAVLRAAGARTRAFVAEVGPAASFGVDSPVVYLAVGAGADEVADLREMVRRGPLERRVGWPFVAHVTLADGAAPTRIHAAVTALADWRVRISFDRVHLLQESRGRVWEPVAEVALGAPAVVGRGGLAIELVVSERADRDVAAWAAGLAGAGVTGAGVAGAGVAGAGAAGATWMAAGAAGAAGAAAGFAVTARREEEVVGLAEGRIMGSECLLDRLVVGPGQRGQGIGTHLLGAVESLAAKRGCECCWAPGVLDSRTEDFLVGRGWLPTTVVQRRLG